MPRPRNDLPELRLALSNDDLIDERNAERRADFLQLPGGVERELARLDGARPGNQKQRPCRARLRIRIASSIAARQPGAPGRHCRSPARRVGNALATSNSGPSQASFEVRKVSRPVTRCSAAWALRRETRRLTFALLKRRTDKAVEQRMPVARRRGEFRMELAADEPRMACFRRTAARSSRTAVLSPIRPTRAGPPLRTRQIMVVEFVAMAMALDDASAPYSSRTMRAGFEQAFLPAQAHRAAEVGCRVAVLDAPVALLPFGDQRDDRMRRVAARIPCCARLRDRRHCARTR